MIALRAALVEACLLALACPPALADRDEAWLHRAELPAGTLPLLALLVDESAAAGRSIAARPAYDASVDYAAAPGAGAACDAGRVYWRRGAGPAPDCATQPGISLGAAEATAGFHCDAARSALARQGFFVASRAAQWRAAGASGLWAAPAPAMQGAIECRADRGRHGATAGAWFAADGTRGPWSREAADEIRWDRAPLADPYVFYHGNYLNYLRAALPPRAAPIVEIARVALAGALRATDGLEAAWLRFGNDAQGGYVARAAAPAAQVAVQLDDSSRAPPLPDAPLAELLSEAAAWLAGAAVRFGRHADADPAALAATMDSYRSPFAHACRPVTLATVSAGIATGDEDAAAAAAALPGFIAVTGGCGADCLAALADFVESEDLQNSTPGRQSARLLWLVPAPVPDAIANAAGAEVADLGDPLAFVNLVAQVHQHDAAVPADPMLSAAGLIPGTRTTHAAAAIYAMSAPRARERWHGNLLRYGLRPGASPLMAPEIVDREGEPAIDPASGLPYPGSRSEWSDAPDAQLTAGGASGRLPDPAVRRVFSDIVSPDLADPRNRLVPGQVPPDRALLGLGAGDRESPAEVIQWLLSARPIGDPGIAGPVVVDYPGQDLALAFIATGDGLLHAFDAATGVERWAWMPRPLLPRLAGLMRDAPTTARRHGLDDRPIVHRFDPDGDGRLDADRGEHLWLFLGPGRGDGEYYALDIAEPDAPRILWSSPPDAAEAAAPRPEPTFARLPTGAVGQSAGGWVILIAGVRGLRILDAETGTELWSAGAGLDATLRLAGMRDPFATPPRVLDFDGNGQMDRAYLLDVAGGLWRFDFAAGATPERLAGARRIARLGDGAQRFQAAPDLSVAALAGRRELAIALGSGRLDRPRETTSVDRMYVIFDRELDVELQDADLHDAGGGDSAMPATSPGWYLSLDRHGAGEKVAGPALTFDHVLRFQTYQPLPQPASAPCGPPHAVRRLYARDLRTGLPAARVERPADDTEREEEVAGLPVELRYAFPGPDLAPCPGCRARPFGIAGTHLFDAGYAGDPVRTSWRNLPPPDSR